MDNKKQITLSTVVKTIWAACIAGLLAGTAGAAVPVHVIRNDFKAMIRAGARSPDQFAVPVPHSVSIKSGGAWTAEKGRAVWQYAVQVPSAVSMSFHATAAFPKGAMLTVRGARTTVAYAAADLHLGQIWSRIQPGDALEFRLSVPAGRRGDLRFSLTSVQAGYRSIGAGVPDHPYFRALRDSQAQSTGNSSCVTNYECSVTAANTPIAAATAAIVVQNLYQCTGTLINNVAADNTPYMLTARHCQTGQLGGGNPGIASATTVYWNASSACGSALGSLYDSSVPSQTGASTVVEQQDAWLIKLDSNPIVSTAQLAGFDASGAAVNGGYTIQHAEGYDKQITTWFGQAAPLQQSDVLGVVYLSNFLETVNSIGNIGPGASGSALVDQNNRLVGSLSLGRRTSDPSGYGACPAASPAAPNGANGVADFTALAAVWNSTADSTSTTGGITLKAVLDPAGTGTQVTSSLPVLPLAFAASTEALTIGNTTNLTWNAAGATACTASGGASGDGWGGTLPATGNQDIVETQPTLVTYLISCAYSGGHAAKASTSVAWSEPTPILQFYGPTQVWTSAPLALAWSSNVGPCAVSGGGLTASNLATTGSLTTTQSAAGFVEYTLTCGPEGHADSSPLDVYYVTPSLTLTPNGTDRRMGEAFVLTWNTAATSCTPSGGAPNDGWSNTEFLGSFIYPGGTAYLQVADPGTYTYTLTCTAGPSSVQQSATITFENNDPYATVHLNKSSLTFTGTPADLVSADWNSNLTYCSLVTGANATVGYDSGVAQGTATIAPNQSGTVQVTVNCYPAAQGVASTASATFTVLPPAAPTEAITFSPAMPSAGQSVKVTWSSTDSTGCGQLGGLPAGNWGFEGEDVASNGSETEPAESMVAGTYTYTLTCNSPDPNVGATTTNAILTVGPPAVAETLTASPTTVVAGSSFTLSWTSQNASSCSAGGGGADGKNWSGSLSLNSTTTIKSAVVGTFTYIISCSSGGQSTSASADVTVTAGSGGDSSSSSGGGGGGGLGAGDLAVLAILGALRLIAVRSRWGAGTSASSIGAVGLTSS